MMAGRLSEATATTRAGGDARIALVRTKALSIRRLAAFGFTKKRGQVDACPRREVTPRIGYNFWRRSPSK